jgi:dolichyl-phosphate-mannose--protein O-mannosyl transferase
VRALRSRVPVRRILLEGAVLVLIPAAVYLTMWAIHFALITHSGPGDAFMTARFQAQLPGTLQYNPSAPRESYWEKLREVHHAIKYGNGALQNVTHPGASKWYTWPTMKHPIGLWESPRQPDGSRRMMVLLGNPVVWWAGLVTFAAGLIAFAMDRRRFAGREFGFLLLVGAVLLNYVPFAAIARVMYLYHYLFALILLITLGAYVLDVLLAWDDDAPWRFPNRKSAAAVATALLITTISFVYFLPLTFGWFLSPASYDARFWILHPHF